MVSTETYESNGDPGKHGYFTFIVKLVIAFHSTSSRICSKSWLREGHHPQVIVTYQEFMELKGCDMRDTTGL
jgi:hypothetical protein